MKQPKQKKREYTTAEMFKLRKLHPQQVAFALEVSQRTVLYWIKPESKPGKLKRFHPGNVSRLAVLLDAEPRPGLMWIPKGK